MADLGNLKAYVDDYDIAFEWGKRRYKIKPSAEEILDYKRLWNDISEEGQKSDQALIWQVYAPLFGCEFDREEYRFVPSENEGHPHHGLLVKLLDEGMDVSILDRLLSAAHAKYFWGDDVAEELAKTGDLGKALKNVRERNEAEAKTATQLAPGETNADD